MRQHPRVAGMLGRSGLPGVFPYDMTRPLPVRDGAVDFALSALTLEHIERPAGPLAEARRNLRRGGRALVIEIHPYLALTGVAAGGPGHSRGAVETGAGG